MRFLSDNDGIIIDLSFDDIIHFAKETGVILSYQQVENWVSKNRIFIQNILKQTIKTDIARLYRKWP